MDKGFYVQPALLRRLRSTHKTPPRGISSADLRACRNSRSETTNLSEDDIITNPEPWSLDRQRGC